jgi:hypothetical protein
MPEQLVCEEVDLASSNIPAELSSELPQLSEFLSLVEDEEREVTQESSGYAVYHKYSKGC